VEKFIGDAVMAVFGIPTLHEDDALRAVRAAAELRERLADLNEELVRDWGIRLETRTAVNTGDVVTGSAETLVTGDAVNVAARLEQVAAPGEVLLGETTYTLVRDAVSVEPIEPLELKGKRQPVRAYRLLEVRPGAVGHERRLGSPMVGRDRQLALLLRAFDNAASERACHLFTILGSAGVGKSRLVEEFLRSLPAETTVLRGRCLPYGEGITFWPLTEAVREAAKLGEGDEPAARRKIASLLDGDENAELIAAEPRGTGDVGEDDGDGLADLPADWRSRSERRPAGETEARLRGVLRSALRALSQERKRTSTVASAPDPGEGSFEPGRASLPGRAFVVGQIQERARPTSLSNARKGSAGTRVHARALEAHIRTTRGAEKCLQNGTDGDKRDPFY
jgi:hypothetical protein